MQAISICRTVVAAALLALSVSAFAAGPAVQPSQGLGQSWPSAPDVSQSVQWHVYIFLRDGIRYVQINDTNGMVHAAFAVSGAQVVVLPIGTDSDSVSTPQQPKYIGSTINSAAVYRDAKLSVLMVPTTTGTGTAWVVLPATSANAGKAMTATGNCSADPEACGGDINAPTAQTLY